MEYSALFKSKTDCKPNETSIHNHLRSVSEYFCLFTFATNKCGLCKFIFYNYCARMNSNPFIVFFVFPERQLSQYIMGNRTSRPLKTQHSRKNIRRNEKLTEDDPKDKVHFADALRKDRHSKVLSKKDYSVAKLNLARGNRIRYCHLSSTLESQQEQLSMQSWEMCNPAFVEENISQS